MAVLTGITSGLFSVKGSFCVSGLSVVAADAVAGCAPTPLHPASAATQQASKIATVILAKLRTCITTPGSGGFCQQEDLQGGCQRKTLIISWLAVRWLIGLCIFYSLVSSCFAGETS